MKSHSNKGEAISEKEDNQPKSTPANDKTLLPDDFLEKLKELKQYQPVFKNMRGQGFLIRSFLKFRKVKNREISHKVLNDETLSKGVCMGLTCLWIFCESNSSKKYSSKYTPDWFKENYNLVAGLDLMKDNEKIDNLTQDQIKNIDEFMGFILFYHKATDIISESKQSAQFIGAGNLKNMEFLREDFPLHDLSSTVLNFSDKSLSEIRKYFEVIQEALKNCGGEIYVTFATKTHIMGLKINSDGYKFYDPTEGKPRENIDDILDILQSSRVGINGVNIFDNENLKLIHMQSYTVGSQLQHQNIMAHLAKIDPPKIISDNLSTADFNYYLDFHISKGINDQAKNILSGKDDEILKNAMVTSLTVKNVKLFLDLANRHSTLLTDTKFRQQILDAMLSTDDKNLPAALLKEQLSVFSSSKKTTNTLFASASIHPNPLVATILEADRILNINTIVESDEKAKYRPF